MSGLLGMFGNKDKEEKAEQEKIGTAMKNLSDQIASLQQQGMGKDSEISRLKEELSELQGKAGNVGDAAKKQMQEMVKLLLRLSSIPRPDDAADDVVGLAERQAAPHQVVGQLRRQ